MALNDCGAESRQVGIATESRVKCAVVLVGQAVSPANCEIETMAGETACPTSHASQRGGKAQVKSAESSSPERRRLGFGHSWHAGGRLVWQAIVPAGGLSGRLVWQAIVPAGGLSGRRRTDHHAVRNYFSGFVSRRQPAAKLRKIRRVSRRRPERPPAGKIACRTKGQSRVFA